MSADDFPLTIIMGTVFSAKGAPLFTAPSAELAEDIVLRLNRDCASFTVAVPRESAAFSARD